MLRNHSERQISTLLQYKDQLVIIMMFKKDIIAVYFEDHTKPVSTKYRVTCY